ncbi:MAG: GntR family transcriptional regulator [Fidelibacterota bacterium]|nr:MAG: GntR family transcriptional regulator [Candidatus Neomarinimicrobiota bacterium]
MQMKQALMEQIESGSWKPGERIPGDVELCKLFGVSRTVVRQALKDMAYEGLVMREKGRGTFVAEPKISSKSLVHSLAGFYEDMVEHGLEPVADVLEQAMIPATAKIADRLDIEVMTPVIKLVRLRYVQEEPIVLVTSYLPYDICRALVNADLTHQSLYAFLETKCGLQVASGYRKIDAVVANEYEAKLLRIEVGAPLLRLDSVSYLKDGSPLEYFHGLFRSDRAYFEVEIDRIREARGESSV